MMNRNKILTLIVGCALLCSVVQAGDVAVMSTIDNDSMQVQVNDKKGNLQITAQSTGTGKTLEEAKLQAYNRILPFLIDKTSDLGALKSYQTVNGIEKGEGADQVAAKILFKGWWELKDAVYRYNLDLILSQNVEEEEARSNLELYCFEESQDSMDELRSFGYAVGMTAAKAKDNAIQNATDDLAEKVFPEMVTITENYIIHSLAGEQREMKIEKNITDEQKQFINNNSQLQCYKILQKEDGTYQAYVAISISLTKIKQYKQ